MHDFVRIAAALSRDRRWSIKSKVSASRPFVTNRGLPAQGSPAMLAVAALTVLRTTSASSLSRTPCTLAHSKLALEFIANLRKVAVGENHSLAVTQRGELYSWGHGDRGRLGVGASYRVGVPDAQRNFFPAPTFVSGLSKETVHQAS